MPRVARGGLRFYVASDQPFCANRSGLRHRYTRRRGDARSNIAKRAHRGSDPSANIGHYARVSNTVGDGTYSLCRGYIGLGVNAALSL